ncbi:glycoside hydrolase family 18 protein [Thermocaproicibacter melissae]|uniref:glycoside hydrolase family 18 protein n=1 Tax=Thermocaproicibacter melissae TaxID=2966552 RepID=UPI0024B083BD|nr:glycosyl hydrolase family 18 protein [Thermocaproicibacter melissae]WBY63972.1 glycosyl hydrolase family 18 protein [Thermocaproicibacter melissae]
MSKKILAGYCINENVKDLTADDARKLTHLNIAAGTVRDGRAVLVSEEGVSCIPQIRKWNPELKCSVCFGGEFSTPCLTQEGRLQIAEDLAAIVRRYGLDGVDIDWEYPCCGENGLEANPADRKTYTLLLEAIRNQLNAVGDHLLLTSAVGAGQYFLDSTQMKDVQKYLDYVYIMTYDLRGAFQILTGHHTNLYTPVGDIFLDSADSAARAFVAAGVPKEKIAIGMAFYTRMWKGVPNRYNGYLQIAKTRGEYGPHYDELLADYIDKNGYKRYWDDVCKAPYLFNGDTFISYDDEQSIRCKCDYVRQQGYAGVFYWEHGCDTTRTLLRAAHESLYIGDEH